MEDGQLELPPVEGAGQQAPGAEGGEALEAAVEQELDAIVAGAASLAAQALAPDGDAAQLPPPTVVAPPTDAPAALTDGVVLAVGTANRAKLDSVASAAERMFSAHSVRAFPADSGVSAQPMSVAETMDGALNRAQGALAAAEEAGVSAEFGVGIEGGLEQIGQRWFERAGSASSERRTARRASAPAVGTRSPAPSCGGSREGRSSARSWMICQASRTCAQA